MLTDAVKRATWKDPGKPLPLPNRPPADEITVEVELVTPMLGGGVAPREPDPHCWLRAASVKGQLRFWWRALHAQSYPKIEALREAEGKLFGLAATFDENDPKSKVLGGPGVVSISVRSLKAPAMKQYPEKLGDITKEYGDIGYLLFPAQKGSNPKPASLAQPDARASLKIAFQSASGAQRAEVLDALTAWLTLGGIGSRTRRGIGAVGVALGGLAPAGVTVPATRARLVGYLRELGGTSGTGDPHEVFHLAGRVHAIMVGQPHRSHEATLKLLARLWKEGRRCLPKGRMRARVGFAEVKDRFASPVLLCVVRVTEGLVPVVLATSPTRRTEAGINDNDVLEWALAPFKIENGFETVFQK